MHLLPGERILRESDNKELILTSHRVRFESQEIGRAQVTSIMLEELSACEIRYTSRVILLYLAITSVILAILVGKSQYLGAGILLGIVLFVAWLMTRNKVLSLLCPGTRLNVKIIKIDTAKEFIDAVEEAKNERYLILSNK